MAYNVKILLSFYIVSFNFQGQGLKGGTAKIDQAELENLDSFARQLATKMRKMPSIDPLAKKA